MFAACVSAGDDKPSLPPKASSDSIQCVSKFVESHKSKVSDSLDTCYEVLVLADCFVSIIYCCCCQSSVQIF